MIWCLGDKLVVAGGGSEGVRRRGVIRGTVDEEVGVAAGYSCLNPHTTVVEAEDGGGRLKVASEDREDGNNR